MASGIIIPGKRVCVDEFTIKWRGLEGEYAAEGMAHVQKLKHKPETLSQENRSIALHDSGIHYQFEPHEGAAAQQQKPYEELYKSGTAVVLRLVKSAGFFGSGRIVVGDGAFGSVECAEALLQQGMYSQLVVKTATIGYPMAILQHFGRENDLNGVRGAVLAFESVSDSDPGKKVWAVCWGDKKAKTIISTAGTLIAGTASRRSRHRVVIVGGVRKTERYIKAVPRPKMIEDMYSTFGKVDQHNFLRQWSLGLERHWHTHHWKTRVFSSIVGISITNAYLLYRFEKRAQAADDEEDFTDFLGHLAYRMIFNPYLSAAPANDSTARITRSAALDVNNLVVPPVSINPVVVLCVYDIVCFLWSFIFSECCWWTC